MKALTQLGKFPPFFLAGGALVFFASSVLLLALFDLFYTPLLGILFCFFALSLGLALITLFRAKDWVLLSFLAVLFSLAILLSLSFEPTVFSGRDQGSIALAAYALQENGRLAWSTPVSQAFFEIYGEGTALNFPGFAYTAGGSLITQFPLAYTAWLGSFVSLFGLSGFALANFTLFIFFGWGMYELLLLFVPRLFAVGGGLLTIFSFLPMWMAKFTLSENLAAVLFVFLTLSVIALLREKSATQYALALFTASLFCFTRIEGFALLLLVLGIIFAQRELRTIPLAAPWKRLVLPALAFLFVFLRDFFVNVPFYKMIGKALLKKIQEFQALGGGAAGDMGVSLGSIFSSYGLFAIFCAGLLGILLCLYKKYSPPLVVLLLALPTVAYLIFPSITPDHPWMLRRYFFSLYPTFVFFAILGIFLLSRQGKTEGLRKLFPLSVFAILFLFQLGPLKSALAITENKDLLSQTQTFSERFTERDLILIDRETTGDPFAMLAGPLHVLFQKQAVYFFNPNDLSRLDRSLFDKVYLLAPEESLGLYSEPLGEKLLPLETVTFTTERIAPAKSAFTSPEKELVEASSVLFEITP